MYSIYAFLAKRYRIALLIGVSIFLLENILLAFDNLQYTRPILGLQFANKLVGGADRKYVEEIVMAEIAKHKHPLQFVYNDKIITLTQEDIGARADAKTITNQLISIGREEKGFNKFLIQNKTMFGLVNVKLSGQISQALLSLKIATIQDEIDQPALPIRPDFKQDITKLLPASDGVKVHTDKLTLLIADTIFDPPEKPLSLPVVKTFTTHTIDEILPLQKQAIDLTRQPISITTGNLVFTLSPKELESLLVLVDRPDIKNAKKLVLQLRLDDKKLNQKLGEFAEKVENITHGEFDEHDARVAIYSQFFSNKRFLAAIPAGSPLPQRVLGEQTNREKKVYLTFDDGPNSIYHPLILDILKEYHIKATFFLIGQNASRDNAVAKRTFSEGNPIGNHSLTHSLLTTLSSTAIKKELQTTNEILKPFANNQQIDIFRPPYGGVNLTVKLYSQQLGMRLYLWDVDPRDWSEPPVDELVRRVVSNVHPDADILLHSNHLVTAKALPKIIEEIKAKGYSFATLE